jgi:hypothetical protein
MDVLSLVSVVYSQVEVSATGRSLVQRSPTDCGASLCVTAKLQERWLWCAFGSCIREIQLSIFCAILMQQDFCSEIC